MPGFSIRSKVCLSQCHPDLKRVLYRAIEDFNFAVICGHRGQEEQHKAYISGKSKLDWPKSRHNKLPSKAADCVPYFSEAPHIRWDDLDSFRDMARAILAAAETEGVNVEWGGDWKMRDYPHFELKGD